LLLTARETLLDGEDKGEREVRMRGSKLYVGNLSYTVTSATLEQLFANYGQVRQANAMEGRGFGFVEMSSAEEAENAKTALDGTDFEGRNLKVDEARPPGSGGQRGGSRGGRGGGSGRY